ncbi:MAG: ATP synthase F0 subunit C [Bacilli bacterium]|jgi:F-type H+-transporting ATPase subunit c
MFLNFLADSTATVANSFGAAGDGFATGMKYIGIGIICIVMSLVSIGEALVCCNAVKGISRNPEAAGKIRSTMILGCSLVETCAIYTLVLSILLIFVA